MEDIQLMTVTDSTELIEAHGIFSNLMTKFYKDQDCYIYGFDIDNDSYGINFNSFDYCNGLYGHSFNTENIITDGIPFDTFDAKKLVSFKIHSFPNNDSYYGDVGFLRKLVLEFNTVDDTKYYMIFHHTHNGEYPCILNITKNNEVVFLCNI